MRKVFGNGTINIVNINQSQKNYAKKLDTNG